MMSNISSSESTMPLLFPDGGVAVVTLGCARWEWDIEQGDGKGEWRLKMGISWLADHRIIEGAPGQSLGFDFGVCS
jgi:2-oxoisovalerate dehydrogenase E2 component (dihydrolipoyl transacylase)